MRKFLAFVSLAALVSGGCDAVGGGGGQGEAAAVDPKQVTAADLKAAVSDPRVRLFYEKRGWQPFWDKDLAEGLTASLNEGARHAIAPQPYLEKLRGGAAPAEREAAMTLAAIDFAQALAVGASDPTKLWDVYTIPRNKADVVTRLAQVSSADALSQWLASLPPQDAEYKALSEAYVTYRQRAGQEERTRIPSGNKIEPGDRDPRVAQIVASLRSNGYLPAPTPAQEGQSSAAPSASPEYTAEVVAAVKQLQSEYGIKPDGIIGDDALEALNAGAAERARILAVNLERRRWLQRQPPRTRIDVNTAATLLDYWRDGAHAHRARVVVGQPGWETPQLGSPIKRLVANPPWTVPESIAQKEILPKGAAYMRSENMSFKNGRIVQEPGPKSALGLVKFDMANPHAIYLHDTPAKALFASEERHASHGCARVENAIGFARMLADDDGKLQAFDKALATGKETPVNLSAEIPVRLLYHTAFWDGARVVFLHDDYGWDDTLAKALGISGQLRRRAKNYPTDVGP